MTWCLVKQEIRLNDVVLSEEQEQLYLLHLTLPRHSTASQHKRPRIDYVRCLSNWQKLLSIQRDVRMLHWKELAVAYLRDSICHSSGRNEGDHEQCQPKNQTGN
jgi:hypothetical protein